MAIGIAVAAAAVVVVVVIVVVTLIVIVIVIVIIIVIVIVVVIVAFWIVHHLLLRIPDSLPPQRKLVCFRSNPASSFMQLLDSSGWLLCIRLNIQALHLEVSMHLFFVLPPSSVPFPLQLHCK